LGKDTFVLKMRIAIVGSDSRAWKKIPDGEKKVNEVIVDILSNAKENKILLKHFLGFDYGCCPMWGDTQTFEGEITVVSGHCPIGEERWYCLDCGIWLGKWDYADDRHEQTTILPQHKILKVYDHGGVGTWAEIIATKLGLKKEIYPAEVHQWNDKKYSYPTGILKILKGYRSRNIQIAEAGMFKPKDMYEQSALDNGLIPEAVEADKNYVLYDIEPAGSCKHCGGFGGYARENKLARERDVFIKCKFCGGDGAYSGETQTYKMAKRLGRKTHKVVIS